MKPIKLETQGDLIAATPSILGFRATNSLMIAANMSVEKPEVGMFLRVDIPPPEHYVSLAAQLKTVVLNGKARRVSAIVVCEAPGGPPKPLPHNALIGFIRDVFASVGVHVDHATWTPEIKKGAGWWCYDDPQCTGEVPDPYSSPVAAASGIDAYGSRAEMRASLEPVNDELVARRAIHIAAALRLKPSEIDADQFRASVVAGVLKQGSATLDEDNIVDFAVALTDPRIRDHCLTHEVRQLGTLVEQLWAELTRALPAPYRAEPAYLLAMTAFLRGDGPTAGVALEVALDAKPNHNGAHQLRQVMDLGIPPDVITSLLNPVLTKPHLN